MKKTMLALAFGVFGIAGQVHAADVPESWVNFRNSLGQTLKTYEEMIETVRDIESTLEAEGETEKQERYAAYRGKLEQAAAKIRKARDLMNEAIGAAKADRIDEANRKMNLARKTFDEAQVLCRESGKMRKQLPK